MAEYRTPLPRLFAATLEAGVNRVLDLDASSAAALERLRGRVLHLYLEGLEIGLYITARDGGLRFDLDAEREPDTEVRGSPIALLAMAGNEERVPWGARGSRVEIAGDAGLARELERLFSRLDPDWEGLVSRFTGEVAGHQIASGMRYGAQAAAETARGAASLFSEWLRDDGKAVPGEQQVKAFVAEVDRLREAADRLEARVKILKERQP